MSEPSTLITFAAAAPVGLLLARHLDKLERRRRRRRKRNSQIVPLSALYPTSRGAAGLWIEVDLRDRAHTRRIMRRLIHSVAVLKGIAR